MFCLVQIVVTLRKYDPGIFPLCLGTVHAFVGFKGHGLFFEVRHDTETYFCKLRQLREVFQDILISCLELHFCSVPGRRPYL